MKVAFYILTVFLALVAVRLTNETATDVVPAIITVGLAIICFFAALISGSIEDNKHVK